MKESKLSNEEIFAHYDVTKEGIVTNKRTGYVKKTHFTEKGYLRVFLGIGKNKYRNVTVHRMVALLYVPNPNNYPQINHKDGIKVNNYYKNLEWCTKKQNKDHAKKIGLRTSLYTGLDTNDIYMIRNSIRLGITWKQIYVDYKMKTGWWNFRDICRGKTWKELL